MLRITTDAILENWQFPFHQQDPFDRIIIAQAIAELIIIHTKSRQIDQYEANKIWK